MIFLLLLSCGLAMAQEPESTAITNTYIVSQTVEKKAWARHKVMACAGRLVDKSGSLVAHADAVAQKYAADNIGGIAAGTASALTNALDILYAHTNEVPDSAYHYALSLTPAGSRKNLAAVVVAESSDGKTDIQWVRYNCEVSLPPNRVVEYHTDEGAIPVKAQWIDWSAMGEVVNGVDGCHKCEIKRPMKCRDMPCLTIINDVIGTDEGFGFGALTVLVDDEPTFTGAITNRLGDVYKFDNGVLLNE